MGFTLQNANDDLFGLQLFGLLVTKRCCVTLIQTSQSISIDIGAQSATPAEASAHPTLRRP